MKKIYFVSLCIFAVFLSGLNMKLSAQTTSFAYVGGTVQTYLVPPCVTSISFDIAGGNGGSIGAPGGLGGQVTGNLSVTGGQVLYICVGQAGPNYSGGTTAGGISPGGEGGGTGGSGDGGGGGGAASSIRTDISTGATSNTSLLSRIAVAGGGGGAGYRSNQVSGGAGGNPGQDGSPDAGNGSFGGGGSVSAGGSAVYCGNIGTFGAGGSCNGGCDPEGGGGGGGWYGGGGTGGGGAGGGCSYSPSGTSLTYTTGNHSGNGYVNITPLCTLPAITGTPSTCVGFNTTLSNSTGGGAWTSSNTAVGTVSPTGVVGGITAGTIIVTYSGTFACGPACTYQMVTIISPPSAITGNTTVCNGLSTTLTSSLGGTSWTSSNPAVATATLASATTGVVTGVSAGSAIISYNVGTACYVTTTVTVVIPPPITGPSGCLGYTTQLSDLTPGGLWSSSNNAVATVGSLTGLATGIAVGSNTLSYTIVTVPGCYVTTPFVVNALPLPITGTTTVCGGQTAYLSDLSAGGLAMYSSSNTGVASVVPLTGLVTGVAAGTAVITYTLPVGCFVTTTETVLQAPTPLTGTFNLCSGISSTFGSSPSSGTWSSSSTFQAIVNPSLGTVTAISAGNPVISYTLSDGCYATQTTTVNNSPLGIVGPASLCVTQSTTLTDATPGGTWISSAPAVAAVNNTTGLATGLAAGTPTLTYKLTLTGCYATLGIPVNAMPVALAVGGGGDYCIGGAGVHITVGGITNPAVNYNLYDGVSMVGSLPGNGGTLYFGAITPAGTYTVQGTTASGCATNMTGHATVTIDPLPSTAFTLNVTLGGNYCVGDPGVDITLSGSESLVSYKLLLGITDTVNSVLGLGGSVEFDPSGGGGAYPYSTGNYTVIAENALTGCTSNIPGSINVNVNVAPPVNTISSGGSYCPYDAGVHVSLDYSDPGITYTLYDNTGASIISLPGASSELDFYPVPVGTYTVQASNSVTGCSSIMNGVATVSTFLPPSVYAVGVTGGGFYCAGTGGAEISVSPSDFGVNYQVYRGSTPIGTALGGNSGTLNLISESTDGTYTVLATQISTNCHINMSGTATITTLPLPSAHLLTGGGSYCVNTPGAPVGVFTSDTGITYQLMNGSSMVGASMPGTGGAISFGNNTEGAYTVLATNIWTGCSTDMPGVVNIDSNTLPELNNVTGGGSYCAGDVGKHIGLDWSNSGVRYTLFNETVMSGFGSILGSNSGLDFGDRTVAGTYIITANNPVTGCTDTMTGNAVISINARPTDFTVTSTSSSYCTGGSGVVLNLTGSDLGLSYQLYLNGIPVGGTVTGSGSAIGFGTQYGAGTYSVIANNTVSLCSANMTATPVVTINPLPLVNNVTGGGQYCAGGTGVAVGADGSILGDTYKLYNTSTGAVVSTRTGTGAAISFGPQTGWGVYKAIVTNPLTTCSNNMVDSVMVIINPLPDADTVTGGGGYCAGSNGVHIGLNNSNSGVNYLLYDGTTLAGTVGGSSGSSIDFGLTTATGSYTVIGVDAATGCSNLMIGTRAVVVNPLPPVYTMFGGGGYCAGTTGTHVNLSGSTLDINYQLYFNGVPDGGTVGATGAALDFGLKTAPGNYTVVATDPATLCTDTMHGASMVSINPLPAVYDVTGGGTYCAGIGTGAEVGVSNSTIGTNYQVYLGAAPQGGLIPGTNTALDLGMHAAAGAYTVVAINPVTSCKSNMTGSAMISISPEVTPSVTLSTGLDVSVCEGAVLNINALPTNGGSSPAYQWFVNGISEGTGGLFTYVPTNGDMVTAIMTSSNACAVPATATYVTLIAVAPYETPTATIMATPGNVTCAGTTVAFNATTAFGGSAPTYTWLKNNLSTGVTGLTFSYLPSDGDVISLMMTSNLPCRTSSLVLSNTELMEVNTATIPVVSISANPSNHITAGQALTLSAAVSNAGSSPAYQWLLNGVGIPGAHGSTLESSNFNNGDSVTCVVTNSNACGAETASNSVVITVGALGVQQVINSIGSFSVLPNPSNGMFTVKGTLDASNDQDLTLDVTDVLGQVIYTGNVKAVGGSINEKVQLPSVANGMYLVNIRSAAGSAVFHLVIEK